MWVVYAKLVRPYPLHVKLHFPLADARLARKHITHTVIPGKNRNITPRYGVLEYGLAIE